MKGKEGCEFGKVPITGERARIAPEGYVFLMTGKFMVDSIQSDNAYWDIPQASVEKLIAEYPDIYQNCLDEAKGNKKEVLKLFQDKLNNFDGADFNTSIKSFSGKYLIENLDEIVIKSDLESWLNNNYIVSIENVGLDPDKPIPVSFSDQKSRVNWKQYFATGKPNECSVRMIKKKWVVKKELLIPKIIDNKDIEIPYGYKEEYTSTKFFEFIKKLYGIKLSDEEKIDLINRRREDGKYFDDDPLKGKYLIFNCERQTLDEIIYRNVHKYDEVNIVPRKKQSFLYLPMEIFVPINLYEHLTGIKMIDNQHREFERILDYLLKHQDLINIFGKIDKYMKKNFSFEEKYFDEFNYENAEKHKGQHQMFKEKLADIANKCLEDKIEGVSELINFLNVWHYKHNFYEDSKYVQCFRKHGVK